MAGKRQIQSWCLRVSGRLAERLSAYLTESIFRRRLAAPTTENDLGAAGKVSVVIPALNEEEYIVDVIRYAQSDPITGEVIVIDDGSTDATASLARNAGAQVFTSTMLGKGASMLDGAMAANFDVIVYLDGDIKAIGSNVVSTISTPVIRGQADFVKASFGRGGGRVTELTAKPMLKLFFPELSEFNQPLGGLVAGKKSLFQRLHFENDYGVDVGLLIDAHLAGARIMQIDIGGIEHDSQSLNNLGIMAQEVSRTILDRAKAMGRLNAGQIMSVFELERRNKTDIDFVLSKLNGCNRLVLLDMDGTVTTQRFVVELAKVTGCLGKLQSFLDREGPERSQQIAALFRFVHKSQFEQVALNIKIRDGVIDAVNAWKRNGYSVGIISDSYFIAAETIRRRIFADFAMAHSLSFELGICQGVMHINRAFSHADGCPKHASCKSNVLRYIAPNESSSRAIEVVAVGDNANDACLLEMANWAFTIEPKDPILKHRRITEIGHFSEAIAAMGLADFTRSEIVPLLETST